MAFILKDGGFIEASKQSPAQFLRTCPQGPYTSLVAKDNKEILSWEPHIQRLVTSVTSTGPPTAVSKNLKSQNPSFQDIEELLGGHLQIALQHTSQSNSDLPDSSVVALVTEYQG